MKISKDRESYMKKQELVLGTPVYTVFLGQVVRGVVTKFLSVVGGFDIPEEGLSVRMELHDSVDYNGNRITGFPGVASRQLKDLYGTAKEAYDAMGQQQELRMKKYTKGIHNIQDLLAFPLKHPFCTEEYTDEAAMDAYIAKCKELTGVTFDRHGLQLEDEKETETDIE
jgi:hypothetical protein